MKTAKPITILGFVDDSFYTREICEESYPITAYLVKVTHYGNEWNSCDTPVIISQGEENITDAYR